MKQKTTNTTMNHLITVAASYAAIKSTKKGTSVAGRILKVRQRKSILQVYNELGRNIFRRKFRMHFETFLRLYRIIKMDLWRAMNSNPNNKRGPNGSIHPTLPNLASTSFDALLGIRWCSNSHQKHYFLHLLVLQPLQEVLSYYSRFQRDAFQLMSTKFDFLSLFGYLVLFLLLLKT